jgi:putative FmdB family regulatory protein
MPEYDYKCGSCKSEFTVHLSMSEHDKKARKHRIRCPKCESTDVRRLIGSFSVMTAKKS